MRVVLIILILFCCCSLAISADDQTEQLSARVEQLVEQLRTDDRAERREVESALIELGPRALPFVPKPDRGQSMSQRVGLERVRQVLQRQKSAASLEESRFTLSGEMTVKKLLTEISRQTENQLDLSTIPAEVLGRTVDVDFKKTSFWDGIDWLEEELSLHYFALSQFELRTDVHEGITHTHQGPVRFEFLKPTSKKLIGNTDQILWRVPVRVYFEPRLRPLYLHWKGDAFQAVGLQGAENDSQEPVGLDPFNPDSSIELAAESDQGGLQTILDFVGPQDQKLEALKIQGSFELILAAGHEEVEFPLTESTQPAMKRVGPARIELIELKRTSVEVYDEDETQQKEVLRVVLDVLYSPQVLNAFESHRTWMFSDPIWIRTANGEEIRRDPLFKTLNQFPGEIEVAYDFDIPKEKQDGSTLLYQIPTLVTTLDLAVEPVLLSVQAEAVAD
ncbi:hypothetical protein Pla110_00120 [Polystyrenella longa]|uniref:Uncharacterized protein n=1 Tax=Polystyrenella longa TaxID=2528007 RepID=A0A518CGG4_9PLAN|nr:hypothetical protein [Polystyrenella longa]QDU78311.1 hypothetical protein Pla110_00120 [Polystyrenella longa]